MLEDDHGVSMHRTFLEFMKFSHIPAAIVRKADKALFSPAKMRQLAASADQRLAAVGRALLGLRSSRLSPEEKRWIDEIERVRADTEASKEEVQVPDFGAGSPDDARGDTQMRQGVTCTEVIGKACRNYSKEPLWAALLFHLIRNLRPQSCVEMGTCLGVSAAYQTAALELNGAGCLHTLEGAPAFAEVARQNLERLGLAGRVRIYTGPFHETLAGVLREAGQVDCCFIDGHHDEAATVAYFDQVQPFLAPESLLIFDDIRWSSGMKRAWDRIREDARSSFWVDLGKVGLCVTGVSRRGGLNLRLE